MALCHFPQHPRVPQGLSSYEHTIHLPCQVHLFPIFQHHHKFFIPYHSCALTTVCVTMALCHFLQISIPQKLCSVLPDYLCRFKQSSPISLTFIQLLKSSPMHCYRRQFLSGQKFPPALVRLRATNSCLHAHRHFSYFSRVTVTPCHIVQGPPSRCLYYLPRQTHISHYSGTTASFLQSRRGTTHIYINTIKAHFANNLCRFKKRVRITAKQLSNYRPFKLII